MNFFSMDNLFFRTVGKLTDLVWLNLLTLLGALPIVTAGASLTAMYSVLLKLEKNEEGGITAGFFAAYRENFVNATKVWLPSLAILLVCGGNLFLLKQGIMVAFPLPEKLSAVCICLIVLGVSLVLLYTFPMLSRYEQTLGITVKNAALLAGAFLPRTVCMLIIELFPVALMLLSDAFLWLWFLYGFTFPGYLCAMLLNRIFEKAESLTRH